MSVRARIALLGGLLLLALAVPRSVIASDCSSLSDCYTTIGAGILAALAIGLLLFFFWEFFAAGAAEEIVAEEIAAEEEIVAEEQAAAGDAVSRAEADSNKVDHIFDNPTHDHQWGATGLSQEGNWNLIRDTIESNYGQIPDNGVFEVTQDFGGYSVTVRGAVVDGVVRIGTAWVNVP